ncbi:MAG: Nif3-like dinuclear metal center hexameric protein [Actinomycetota bacterium]|nr:Nif3-like dinuclear metal center hexameric protein [Actinomycetota bacterium]
MASRDELISFCDELLDIRAFGDYGPNGLQVPGADEVTIVASAVSAHLASIEAAAAAGAQLLITHHGLFWDFHPRTLSPAMAARLKAAFAADLSIAGYHLPLDAHREIGNNVLLSRQLGFEPGPETIGDAKGRAIGVVAHSAAGIAPGELFSRVERDLRRKPLVFAEGPDRIRSIGIVTGAAASDIHTAIDLGLDAFLTGEPSEHVMADAREGHIHFVAAGHYATETLGIRALGDVLARQFGIEHQFIEVSNPI